jgi:hypothetical protein
VPSARCSRRWAWPSSSWASLGWWWTQIRSGSTSSTGRARRRADPDAVAPASPEIVEVGWFARSELPDLQHETVAGLMALARADVS